MVFGGGGCHEGLRNVVGGRVLGVGEGIGHGVVCSIRVGHEVFGGCRMSCVRTMN